MTPLWATPARRDILAAIQAHWGCTFGEEDCRPIKAVALVLNSFLGDPNGPAWFMRAALAMPRVLAILPPAYRLHIPDQAIAELLHDWKAEDREQRGLAWKREQRQLHAAPQLHHRGPFDSLAHDDFMAQRPVWEITSIGVGAFTFKRVAQVRIPGLHKTVWVDLQGIKAPSKNATRKATRYGRGSLPKSIQEQTEERIRQVVAELI